MTRAIKTIPLLLLVGLVCVAANAQLPDSPTGRRDNAILAVLGEGPAQFAATIVAASSITGARVRISYELEDGAPHRIESFEIVADGEAIEPIPQSELARAAGRPTTSDCSPTTPSCSSLARASATPTAATWCSEPSSRQLPGRPAKTTFGGTSSSRPA